MTNENLGRSVRLPLERRGTIIKAHEPQDGMPVYDIRADDGQIMRMVEIAQDSLIPRDDYDRLNTMVRGIRDGTIKTTTWTADQYRKRLLGED
ncbi:hypothetical protein [Mesorhizobium sp. KR2-14]|uniref:hypothetical protein n=1 Tax=Mesorhizobium sp. KR2-14 TaxID=3156610 RepID=UPI0032B3831A